jgi:hypothetical protein
MSIFDISTSLPIKVTDKEARDIIINHPDGGIPPKGVWPNDFLAQFGLVRPESLERPSNDLPHLENEDWVIGWTISTKPPVYATADEAKAAVKVWIEQLLNQITDKYPRQEIDSWGPKNEAARCVLDGSARVDQSNMIQAEADELGRTSIDQATLIVANADQFTAIIQLTSGLRQQIGIALDAATTTDEYQNIVNSALVTASSKAAQFGLSIPQ